MVGIKKHKKDNPKSEETQAPLSTTPPKLARRKANRKSTMKLGRTIRGERERLETASERIAVHKKNKRQKTLRIAATIVGLTIAIIVIVWFISLFMPKDTKTDNSVTTITVSVPYTPTIEVVDEDASATGGNITSRMKEYIGQAEADLRELGYTPSKAVIPAGTIREVHFYLDGFTGYIKMNIDRGTGVSAEDTDRMIRYLKAAGTMDFTYIDVRIDGKAYWKPLPEPEETPEE